MSNLQGFATIPRILLHDSSLSTDAKMIYLILSSYVGKHGDVWPSHKTIAEDVGLSVSTVKRQLRVLRDRGLVRWTNHLAPGTECKTVNRYELITATAIPQQLPIAQPDPTSTQTLGSVGAIEDSGRLTQNLGSQRTTNDKNKNKPKTTSSVARTRKRTDRDDLWDAVAEVCGIDSNEIPKSARSALGKVVTELRDVGAIPGQVRVRARRYHQRYEGRAALTPTALLKHWALLGDASATSALAAGQPRPTFAEQRQQQREAADAWMSAGTPSPDQVRQLQARRAELAAQAQGGIR